MYFDRVLRRYVMEEVFEGLPDDVEKFLKDQGATMADSPWVVRSGRTHDLSTVDVYLQNAKNNRALLGAEPSHAEDKYDAVLALVKEAMLGQDVVENQGHFSVSGGNPEEIARRIIKLF